MGLGKNYTQVGYILDDNNGMDYRYPLTNMSYISSTNNYNYTGNCLKTSADYDSRCTAAYQELKNGNHEVLIYNEDGLTKVLLNATQGAFVYYLPLDYFDDIFEPTSDYTFF